MRGRNANAMLEQNTGCSNPEQIHIVHETFFSEAPCASGGFTQENISYSYLKDIVPIVIQNRR
jgi:hypothetical protein